MKRIGALETEGRAAALADLDRRPTAEIVRAVVDGHDGVLAAVAGRRAGDRRARRRGRGAARRRRARSSTPARARRAGSRSSTRWSSGPTYSVPDGSVVALVAGAEHPVGSLAEAAAEDDAGAGAAAVRALGPRRTTS